MVTYRIPVIPGDGVGPEVIAEGKKVIESVGDSDGFNFEWLDLPYGADHYLKTGELITEQAISELKNYKAVFLGALGDPRVEPGILELGILLRLRFVLDQYVNLRPVYLFEGVPSPLANKGSTDVAFTVVRENTEDFYVGLGGRFKNGKHTEIHDLIRETYSVKFNLDVDTNSEELAYQIGAVTREGAKRIITYAFDYAKKRNRKKVTGVDKVNVLTHVYGLWRDTFRDVAKNYQEITHDFALVDAVSMWFLKNPEWFDVVVTPNLFGDILTDLGAMIQGGMGFAPGGNINPEGTSMFEPIHGSAPKYKGLNTANPIATILAGGMLLEQLGLENSGKKIELAVIEVLKEGRVKSRDIGGTSKTSEIGDEVASKIKSI